MQRTDEGAEEDAPGALMPVALMEEAVESIGTSLDERVTCEELVGFLCRYGCEAAAAELLEEDVPAGRHDLGELKPARVATAGRGVLLEAPQDTGRQPGVGRGAGTMSVPGSGVMSVPGAGAISVSGSGVMSIPLVAHGRLYGVLLAVRSDRPLTDQETATLSHAARLAAVHIRHARRHATVRSTALNLQRALLAEPGRPHPNLDLATRYLPAGGGALVGGDWFETVRLHYGRSLLVMGDVMGHGVDAAVDMNAYRSMLRYVASTDLPPHRVLRQLDAAIAGQGTRRPATCLLARIDPARRTAALASAGHLPPAVFAGDGTGALLDLPVGPPLGTGVGGYELVTHQLNPDDTLLMFTDGLVERREEDIDASLTRLARLRLRPESPVEQFLEQILTGLDAYRARDDVAVLAARIRPRGSGRASAAS